MAGAPTRSRFLGSIGNKMLAVLVAVAVIPAVTVSIYALRKASDALAYQALTLTAEGCATDARRAESLLDSIRQELGNIIRDNADLNHLLPDLMQPPGGERDPVGPKKWDLINADVNRVDQRMRSVFEQQPSCRSLWIFSLGFSTGHPTAVLKLDRKGDDVVTTRCVQPGRDNYLRPKPEPVDALTQNIMRRFDSLWEEHPESNLLRFTVTDGDDALEIFAGRVQETKNKQNLDVGWVFELHSWRSILAELRGGSSTNEAPGNEGRGSEGRGAVASLYEVKPGIGLAKLATSRPGTWAEIPDELDLAQHAAAGNASAALFERGEVQTLAFAPFTPRRGDSSLRYVIAIQRPARELMENLKRFRLVFTAILTAALLLAALVGLLLARRLTRPLRVLRDGATQIGRGDLSQTLEVHTGDEAEELAGEFNAMALKLRSLYQGMETTITERTEQLQRALDDLRRAHTNLVESERRYSDIVENASDLIQVTDAQGRILSANRRQAELLGVAAEEIKGRDFFDFVAADVRDATRRAFAYVLSGNSLQAFESALSVGAQQIPVEISATPVLDGEKPVGVRAILRDVGERKVMEARVIKAERLSSVGALAAGVAHEINNPLGIINLFAQRLLEKAKKGEFDIDKLEKIVEQGRRVAAITRNLLDFARAAPTRFAPFDVGEVVRSTCALVSDRARNGEIELVQEVAADVPRIVGNAQQISQVVLNLLLNAIQALGRGGRVVVRVAETPTSRLPTAGRAVRVTVEDSGPGIPPDALPRLFEPFFTTKAPGEGTGLGLSVSWGILKEHHGAIFASNRPEGGARFEFELPVEGETSHAAPAPAGSGRRAEG